MSLSIKSVRQIATLNYLNSVVKICKNNDGITLRYKATNEVIDPTLNEIYLEICVYYSLSIVNEAFLRKQVRRVIKAVENIKYDIGEYQFEDFIHIPKY